MVIVGGGEAGARAAAALRQNGFEGHITVISDEMIAPYERPPLSKTLLTTEQIPAPTYILSEERRTSLRIRLLCGVAATSIDRLSHMVVLANGRRIRYDRLLIATGANPRPIPGPQQGAVLYLRRFPDAIALRSCLKPNRHLVVIGGGFIGLEVAASARVLGCEVTLIEFGPRLLIRAPEPIATVLAARHQAEGVELRTATSILAVRRRRGQIAVVLTGGESIHADVVVAGIGAVPEVRIAEAAGLSIDNGIAVDSTLRTADPDIFAAGDCCSFLHPLYGSRRIRLEAWRNAQDQGNLAARNMLGGRESHSAVPWLWSDQYDLTFQVAGLTDAASETVIRDISPGARIYFHLAGDGRLVAVTGLGPNAAITRDIRISELLISRSTYVNRTVLGDPSIGLKTLLAAA